MKRSVYMLTVLAILFSTVEISAQDSAPDTVRRRGKAQNNVYIVQMVDSPVVSYRGGISGLAATKPARGRKIDPTSPQVVAYVSYLDERHNGALRSAGGGRKIYDYRYSFNGFAAELTPAQAAAIKSAPGVVAVTKDELQFADTSNTPTFLKLNEPGGLWQQVGGVGNAGENIIIGVVDSGVWPESLSYSDRTGANGNASKDGKLSYQQISGWHGKCVPGEQFTASNCNQKLIGAQYFNAAWGGNAGLKTQRPWEFASPRDYNGHGTHTSSTAGGNYNVTTNGPAAVLGTTSGMAPRARIAVYKALWSNQDASQSNGFTSDLVAAIDQAVADGVDVINYSVSGSQTNFLDPAEVSFLFAADAGVFVSASAGNSGPTTSTVAHPGPWLTTVAAGTHNRNGQATTTLGNGSSYTGASVASALGPRPLIDAAAAGLPGADPTAVRLCFAAVDNGGTPVLDPAKVAGKIVVCDRGVTARVNKSLAVLQAGGAGVLLVNTSPSSLNADFHFVPTVHLADSDRAAVKAYAATPGATATINQATILFDVQAPFTASFSSRGPLAAGGGDLLKPDVIAPGQDILASVAPPGNHGFSFNVYSGTSMSAPHIAGIAALLKQQHPDWTPMAIKSALMTSASDILDGPNTHPLVIFRQGAGHVVPNKAVNPGLVYNSGFDDWLAFLCGTTTGVAASTCGTLEKAGFSLDASDLNVPSIAIGDMAGVQKVKRKVTNVGQSPATYTASVAGISGVNTSVSPASLTLNPGQTKSYEVTFTRTSAALNSYTAGQLTWSEGTNQVRIPVTVRPVGLAAPLQVSGTGAPISYNVRFGYDGPFAGTARGLIPAETTSQSISDDPTDTFVIGGPGVVALPVTIAAGTTYARFSLFDENVSPSSDLDLYVYRGSTLVGSSAGGTSAEEVNLVNPAAGSYTVYVHGFGVPDTASFTLFSWLLGSNDVGNMTVSAPGTATTGATGSINLTFSGLAANTRYLGAVAYSGVSGLPDPTIVRVDTE
ncbi:MAG TPA: S8 family peptidase [Terriglobales bacterium]|nr:S8 family peptidase [Terriglobales bacterium]